MQENSKKFEERLKRVNDAIALKEPDRVPCIPQAQTYPYLRAGFTMAEIMYDTEKAKDSIRKYLREYEPDMGLGYGAVFAGQGPIMEKAGIKWLQWAGQPGSNIDKNSIHQYIEKAYLEEDEYPELLSDLSGWITRRWLPRCFSAFEPLANMDFRGALGYGYLPSMLQFINPAITETFKTMSEIGMMAGQIYGDTAAFDQEIQEMGFPVEFAATTTTAFDQLSDTLRGTMGTMVDLFEQPENVLSAVEMFFPGSIFSALAQAKHSIGKWVFIPLHKGMDGFMSPKQYNEFYWPTLKRLINALIDNGCIPYVYTEGKYDSRLETLTDIPKGKVIYHFEDVDMAEAKRIIGPHACITGGFNGRLLETGTKEQVVDGVKRLLDICAPGGGYIFDVNDTMDNCKPENVEAMFDTVKTYGKY